MSTVNTGIEFRRFPHMLSGMKAAQAKDIAEKQKDKKRREEQAQKELEAMQPILKLFRAGYKKVLGAEITENIIRSYNQPIAKYALIARLERELIERGVPCKSWKTIASKAFL